MTEPYSPIAKEKWPNQYYDSRKLNNPERLKQFKLDEKYIKKHISSGTICDVGCSTGEFLRSMEWTGELYGLEISDFAKNLASDIISFDKNIFTEKDFFDLVIYRGTIQHVDEPFRMIKQTFSSLKPGGYVVFLATPNRDSILYLFKKNLALLDFSLNFYIPGAKDFTNALSNYGYNVIDVHFPYYQTPYCRLVNDHFKFLLNIFSPKFYAHAFWKSSMNIVAQKPK